MFCVIILMIHLQTAQKCYKIKSAWRMTGKVIAAGGRRGIGFTHNPIISYQLKANKMCNRLHVSICHATVMIPCRHLICSLQEHIKEAAIIMPKTWNLPEGVTLEMLDEYSRQRENAARRASYARNPERVMRQRLNSAVSLLERHGCIDKMSATAVRCRIVVKYPNAGGVTND